MSMINDRPGWFGIAFGLSPKQLAAGIVSQAQDKAEHAALFEDGMVEPAPRKSCPCPKPIDCRAEDNNSGIDL